MMNILCQHNDDDDMDSVKLIHFVCKVLLQKLPYSAAMDCFLGSHHPDPLLYTATKNGAYELVKINLSYFPELLWYLSGKDGKLLLHVAVEYRQEEIFNHIMGLIGENIESYSEIHVGGEAPENILHLTAKLAPTDRLHSFVGPAFQMQNELQWFKAVESLVYKDEKVEKNENGMTPIEYFFTERKGLIKNAKEWMKYTSNSCMVIAALVATVAFASMVTVPGGTDDKTGLPIHVNRVQFMIFLASNALSMLSSAIALLVSLSIQTSRYTERDFMKSLPNSLLIGFLSLFIAVATMMIAFSMAIELAINGPGNIPVTLVACIPAIVFSFTGLQIPLLIQKLASGSGPGISSLNKDQKLCLIKKPVARRHLNIHP